MLIMKQYAAYCLARFWTGLHPAGQLGNDCMAVHVHSDGGLLLSVLDRPCLLLVFL